MEKIHKELASEEVGWHGSHLAPQHDGGNDRPATMENAEYLEPPNKRRRFFTEGTGDLAPRSVLIDEDADPACPATARGKSRAEDFDTLAVTAG